MLSLTPITLGYLDRYVLRKTGLKLVDFELNLMYLREICSSLWNEWNETFQDILRLSVNTSGLNYHFRLNNFFMLDILKSSDISM